MDPHDIDACQGRPPIKPPKPLYYQGQKVNRGICDTCWTPDTECHWTNEKIQLEAGPVGCRNYTPDPRPFMEEAAKDFEAAVAAGVDMNGISVEDMAMMTAWNRAHPPADSSTRTFDTGATRDTDDGKPNYAGFLSPIVIKRFGEYMLKHQVQSNGEERPPDNWKKGIPLDAYMDSGFRHFMDWWSEHDGYESREGLQDALCGLMFNVMGYLFETIKEGE